MLSQRLVDVGPLGPAYEDFAARGAMMYASPGDRPAMTPHRITNLRTLVQGY